MRLFARGGPRPRLSRNELWTGGAFVLIVACFVAGIVFAERRMGRITARSREVSDDALPSVLEVCHMREELLDIDENLGTAAPIERGPLLALASRLQHLDADERHGWELARLEATRALWERVRGEIVAMEHQVDEIETDPIDALEGERSSLHAHVHAIDAALESIDDFEQRLALQSERLAEIERTRTGGISYGLAGFSALVAAFVAMRTIELHRKHRRAMEERVDELETFAVRVAHDIRSPLAPAMFALKRLEASAAPEAGVQPVVERGMRSLRSIERIVEALLSFAASGAAPAGGESTNVCEAIDSVVAQHHDACIARDIELDVKCSCEVRAACSEGVLASILGNLVGNAIKFMGDVERRRIVVRASQEHGRVVCIEVEDSGPGLPPDSIDRVFQPYFRADTSVAGLGLGLATVKRLAVAHGGRVGVTPAVPHGCVFWVELPAAS
jgi:signal transduction histidine kinase